jgi:hypothetical protein
MSGFKKGDLLRVIGATDPYATKAPRGVRRLTREEQRRMSEDPYYQGLGEDGETRLIPRHQTERIEPGTLVTVLRSRAKAPVEFGLGKWSTGHVLVLDPGTGKELYVKRNFLEAIPASDEGEN